VILFESFLTAITGDFLSVIPYPVYSVTYLSYLFCAVADAPIPYERQLPAGCRTFRKPSLPPTAMQTLNCYNALS